MSLLGSWSWPRRRSSAPHPSRTRAFPAAPRRSGAGVPPGALPRWPLAPPSARRVSASSGPRGGEHGAVTPEVIDLAGPQLLRRCWRPSHGDTSPPAARRAGGFATCGGAGGRQLFTPPPPPRRSGLTAAGAREPRPLRRRTALAERPSGLDCRRRSACLSGTLCVARQAGGTIRLRPAVAEAGSPRRKAICAMCSLYELRPESRDVGRRPASESHRRA